MKALLVLAFFTVISVSYADITPKQFSEMSNNDQYRVIEQKLDGTKPLAISTLSLPLKTKRNIYSNLYKAGYRAQYEWGDTILEGDFALADDKLGFSPFYAYVNNGKIIAYRMRIYAEAYMTADCNYYSGGSFEDCWPGDIEAEVILDYRFKRILIGHWPATFYED